MTTIGQQLASAYFDGLSNRPLFPFTTSSSAAYIAVLLFEILLYRPDLVDSPNRISSSIPFFDLQNMYDYIVIGAGSAGCVVASRLSENPNVQVLLLEAGGPEPIEAEVPFLTPMIGDNNNLKWNFVTEPSPYWGLSQNNRAQWPRGRVAGGSSILNTVAYVRGNRKDFDRWRDMGNPGWGYDDVLPYFKKSEDMRIPALRNSPYHGVGGYLTIEQLRFQSPLTDTAEEAGIQMGYGVTDANGATQFGFTRTQCNVRDGLRCSSAKAFLRPAKRRSNLHISLDSYVTRILINSQTKTAEGVQFLKNISGIHTYRTAYARREIIVCAGAIQSPQLLMLSGVGPTDHLTAKGIPTIVNSPGVGQNLQDHVAVGGVIYIINNNTDIGPYGIAARMPYYMTNLARTEFVRNHKGPLYSLPRSEANLFANSKYNTNPDWPDIQIVVIPTGTNDDGGVYDRKGNDITEYAYNRVYAPHLYNFTLALSPVFLRPYSRGSIKLRDNNPSSYPLIYAPYYNDPRDMKYQVEAARIAHRFTQAPAFRKYNLTLNQYRFPGCEPFPYLSYEYWECQARHFTSPFWHPSGTCKMGPSTDRFAVVDSRLRVHGVKNLRVADAAIMPYITSGNTNAPTIMIGEKAAAIIKQDAALSYFFRKI